MMMTWLRPAGLSMALVVSAATLAYAAPKVERVSVASDGTPGNHRSVHPKVSADGRTVAFMSQADNLVSDDTNGVEDVFVHDRLTGATSLVSVASDGTQADGYSPGPNAISGDGRFVAFTSTADNLVEGDIGWTDVFVHDRSTGSTQLVNRGLRGATRATMSADGRSVAFESEGADPPLNGGRTDIYVWDRPLDVGPGTISLVSVSSTGAPASGASWQASMSADARFVAFASSADDLVSGDTNERIDVFVRDRLLHTTERVSVTSDGREASGLWDGRFIGDSRSPAISPDGRSVAFISTAVDLVEGDTNGRSDVFVHDRLTRTTERVSVSSDGSEASAGVVDIGSASGPSISADGRFVGFTSSSSNLVDDDENGSHVDVFVHDRLRGKTIRVPHGPDETLYGVPRTISMSSDGSLVAFDRSLHGTSSPPHVDRHVWVAELDRFDRGRDKDKDGGTGGGR